MSRYPFVAGPVYSAAHYLAGSDILHHAFRYLRDSRDWKNFGREEAQAHFDAAGLLAQLEWSTLTIAEEIAGKQGMLLTKAQARELLQ